MPRLLLLRHGQSTWNAEQRWQGWADPPLSALGERQAEAAARSLAGGDDRFDRVVCSDLGRARRTAEVITEGLELGPVEVDAGLRERDVGDFTGLTTEEIGRRWPAVLEAWRERRLTTIPGGEEEPALVARVLAALARVGTDGDVLIVTHGGVIRSLERHLGVEPVPLPNLCGRWFEFEDGRLQLGPPVTPGQYGRRNGREGAPERATAQDGGRPAGR